MFITAIFVSSLVIDIINIPYDKGANKIGSRYAFNELENDLNFLPIHKKHIVNISNNLHDLFDDGFLKVYNTLDCYKFPLCIGGNHLVSLSSIFAVNEYCLYKKYNLGILYFSVKADLNTIETSPILNLHGMLISILCGHELNQLSFGNFLYTSQFAYYGKRDIDHLEFNRLQKYNMLIIDDQTELKNWVKKFDYVHLSLDMNCFDTNDLYGVNTPVKTGPKIEYIYKMLDVIKNSKKLISMDIVEYNPTIENNNNIITNVLKKIFIQNN
tara:strand:+ start:9106 stop:9915 length:810 start_codon:yes stop_codon:yes gene_type:complete